MKKNFILFLILLLTSQVFSQKKGQPDPKDAQIDSLSRVIDKLTLLHDSLTKVTASVTSPDNQHPQLAAAETHAAPINNVSAAITDSLSDCNQTLAMQLDAAHVELNKYKMIYTAIKEKVLKRDFDPARMAVIIDSLAAHRDSTFSGLSSSSVFLKDSISILNKEKLKLQQQLDSYTKNETMKAGLISELKQLKELLDSKIITQSEFDIKKTLVLQKWK